MKEHGDVIGEAHKGKALRRDQQIPGVQAKPDGQHKRNLGHHDHIHERRQVDPPVWLSSHDTLLHLRLRSNLNRLISPHDGVIDLTHSTTFLLSNRAASSPLEGAMRDRLRSTLLTVPHATAQARTRKRCPY